MEAATLAAVLAGVGAADSGPWAAALAPAMVRHSISTEARRAMFLANVLHETGGLKVFEENLNYSVTGLLKNFSRTRISADDARALGRKPGEPPLSKERQAAIANCLYGGDWGRRNLGNTQPNDGWYFRGRGLLQLTGRSNHTRFAKACGCDVVKLQTLLDCREGSAESACAFWEANGCNAAADAADLARARRLVNGGELGLDEVEGWMHRLESAAKDAAPWWAGTG